MTKLDSQQYHLSQYTKPGSDLYYATLSLNQPVRHAIYALYGLQHALNDILLTISDPGVARVKLQWWREEIQRFFMQQAKHPLCHWLMPYKDRLNQQYFLDMIDGVQYFLDKQRFNNQAELDHYCRLTFGNLILLKNQLYNDTANIEASLLIGLSLAKSHLLQQLRPYLNNQYSIVPQSLLSEFNITEHELHQWQITPTISELLKTLHQQMITHADQALSHVSHQKLRSSDLIELNLSHYLVNEIAENHYDILSQQYQLTPLRKLFITWKTKRHIKRERLHFEWLT